MNTALDDQLSLLEENMDLLTKRLKMTSASTRLILAATYTASGDRFDEAEFRRIDEQMKGATGWFTVLSREIRFCINAILIQKHAEPNSVRVIYGYLIKAGFARQQQTYIAAAILSGMNHPKAFQISEKAFSLYRLLKKEHPILTNKSDVSLIVLLVQLEEDVAELLEKEEHIYTYLNKNGFRKCDDLQTLACLLAYISESTGSKLAQKTARIKEALEDQKIRLRSSCYPIYGVLALLANEYETAGAVIEFYQQMRSKKISLFIGKDLYFQTAASLYINEVLNGENKQRLIDPSLLVMTEMVIRAQQAATAAAIAASTSAAAASNSGN
ncbi:DUF4003 domain-containing protein [Sporolactobacillus shoreicorticis]|uniref:DUF4003 family protein n=1 Tax=Sporolactobacillus shoreicorticis TaxID=1923877 RepID=A0ABW5RZ72_9BACL|nr:DUF4003 family protein [Sporolactobacillus shoreicorticis]MCO7126798.1 DUF4003 domain-containing protein [Sporolactobacillus shoreicorticis]